MQQALRAQLEPCTRCTQLVRQSQPQPLKQSGGVAQPLPGQTVLPLETTTCQRPVLSWTYTQRKRSAHPALCQSGCTQRERSAHPALCQSCYMQRERSAYPALCQSWFTAGARHRVVQQSSAISRTAVCSSNRQIGGWSLMCPKLAAPCNAGVHRLNERVWHQACSTASATRCARWNKTKLSPKR